jgi:hypothetical protein
MANNRSNIRAAVKTLLDGETDAGDNVYTNRETSLSQTQLPAIIIQTDEEQARPESGTVSRRSFRTLSLKITVKLEESDSIDDDLDALLADVEDLISASPSLGGTVLSAILTSSEMSIDGEGEKLIGVGTMTYECQYIS